MHVERLRIEGAFCNEIVSGVGGRQILLEDPVATWRIDLITLP